MFVSLPIVFPSQREYK